MLATCTALHPHTRIMEKWQGKVAIVTGASSGIGMAISKELAKAGMIVIGCARSKEKIKAHADDLAQELESGSPGKLVAMRLDVTKEEDITRVFAAIKRDYDGVDVCVCAAGMGLMAPLLSGKTSQWRDMMEVNVLGMAVVIREAVKSMEEKGSAGHVINMCSLSGIEHIPGLSVLNFYAITKSGVNSLTQGVRDELRGKKSKIRITQLSPGSVASGFFKNLTQQKDSSQELKKMESSTQPGQSAMAAGLVQFSQLADEKVAAGAISQMEEYQFVLPTDIANAMIYALSQPDHVEVNDMIIRPRDQAI